MPSLRFNDEKIERIELPAEGKQVDYRDTLLPGLILRVNYAGRKSWRALHYVKSKKDSKTIPTTYKLGVYPVLKTKEAREKARAFLKDPQKALAQAETGSFKEVAENFVRRHVAANKLRSHDEIERCLSKYVYPRWEHRPFREISRRDVAELLDQIEDNHGPRMADIVLAIVRKMMNWFATRDDDYISPVVRGMGRAKNRKRDRMLNDGELRALWTACDEIDNSTFGRMLKVLLLTAQRKARVQRMRWNDISDDGVWTIAKEHDREKGHGAELRLPHGVLDIIKQQPRVVGNSFVFAGSRGGAPFDNFSQAKRELDKKLRIAPWRIHDLRRTARSLMSRAGVQREHSERVLGHVIQGVEGVYDVHAYSDEKADALKRLALLVDSIVNPPPANIAQLDQHRRKQRRRKAAA